MSEQLPPLACPAGHIDFLELAIKRTCYFRLYGQDGATVFACDETDAEDEEGSEQLWCRECGKHYDWPLAFSVEWS